MLDNCEVAAYCYMDPGLCSAQRLPWQWDEHSHLRALPGLRVDREFALDQKHSFFHAYDSEARPA